MEFKLKSPFTPKGDQPKAIKELSEGIKNGEKFLCLLGVTGSGKTFTIANVIQEVQKPTIIISHNKTLAAQLYGEFKQFFPENAVEYFISYYDYYQPEAYVPELDLYIEKDASINEEIERLRLSTTSSLIERRDVIVVASVSCIYNLGEPWEFKESIFPINLNKKISRDELIEKLVDLQYSRNDIELKRCCFRVRGDIVEVHPSHKDFGIRFEFYYNTLDKITIFDLLTNEKIEEKEMVVIYPAKYFTTNKSRIERAVESIEEELKERVAELKAMGKLLEAQRLEQRTRFDIEMLLEFGYCPGIENYSRHLLFKKPGERPYCLLDYFPKDYLMVIDESHITIPQIYGMYRGDRSRKEVLVEYGFRLPSCLDNRPLKFDEFESLINQVIFTSATPGDYELKKVKARVVEQIVRPTGLVDPKMIIRPTENQIDDMINEIRKRVKRKERVLVTTLTKRMAEDLADYLKELGFKVNYLHSEIDPIERVEILRNLRLGNYDVLVGINLLREGLDLPEVSLVCILDADKTGFLRDARSLIQIAGRASRNVRGEVILYADNITEAIKEALKEAERRRRIQLEYNKKHGIKPESIKKTVQQVLLTTVVADAKEEEYKIDEIMDSDDKLEIIEKLTIEMKKAAENLEFERAAFLRDKIRQLKDELTIETLKNQRKRRRK
ncbi:MAG: excinuclease ABC subunit UvrB [candidate division WOR-3 bacterium]|uniref:UvrABC system protein B n=1 Tax=candidate division WOR-3 bacterium TaxID=2052148 RepID=A0A7V4FDL3_UNCW3